MSCHGPPAPPPTPSTLPGDLRPAFWLHGFACSRRRGHKVRADGAAWVWAGPPTPFSARLGARAGHRGVLVDFRLAFIPASHPSVRQAGGSASEMPCLGRGHIRGGPGPSQHGLSPGLWRPLSTGFPAAACPLLSPPRRPALLSPWLAEPRGACTPPLRPPALPPGLRGCLATPTLPQRQHVR